MNKAKPAPREAQSPPGEGFDQSLPMSFPVITDPMAEALGGRDDWKEESEDVEIPEEIKSLFDIYGLSSKGFRTILKAVTEGDGQTGGQYIKSWARSFPSIDWIALNYGPGKYQLCFAFSTSEDGKRKNQIETLDIEISEKRLEEHEEFIFKRKIAKAVQRRKEISNVKLNKQLELEYDDHEPVEKSPENTPQSMIQYVQQFSGIAQALGFNRGGGTDWSKIMSMAIPLIPAVIGFMQQKSEADQARQREFMTLLISTMSSNSNSMLDIVKAQSGVGGGNQAAKEFKDMIMGVIDIKKALGSTQEDSVADRIFGMLESVLPSILQMAALSRQQRQATPQYNMAKMMMDMNPDLRKLKEDPAVLEEVIRKWDAHFGWEQADMIIDVAELRRPDACVRLPHQQYPAGDSRNPGGAEKGEYHETDL